MTKFNHVFSAHYRGYDLVLSQPTESELLTFNADGDQVMSLALTNRDDLVKVITIAKELIDETKTKGQEL